MFVRGDRLVGSEGEDLHRWFHVFRELGPKYRPEWLGALLLTLCGKGEELCRLLRHPVFRDRVFVSALSDENELDVDGDEGSEEQVWAEKSGRGLGLEEFVRELSKVLLSSNAKCERCGGDTPVQEGYFYGGSDRVSWAPGGDWTFVCPRCRPGEDHGFLLLRIRGDQLLGSGGERLTGWFHWFSILGENYNASNLAGLLVSLCGTGILPWVEPQLREEGQSFDA
jgi:hypothetical protein